MTMTKSVVTAILKIQGLLYAAGYTDATQGLPLREEFQDDESYVAGYTDGENDSMVW